MSLGFVVVQLDVTVVNVAVRSIGASFYWLAASAGVEWGLSLPFMSTAETS